MEGMEGGIGRNQLDPTPACTGSGELCLEGAGAGGHSCGTALGTEQQLPPFSRAPRPRETGEERGQRAARLLQNIPWARLVQQALLMRSIILLQKNRGGIRHARSPSGWRPGRLLAVPPCVGREGELRAGQRAGAGHGWRERVLRQGGLRQKGA